MSTVVSGVGAPGPAGGGTRLDAVPARRASRAALLVLGGRALAAALGVVVAGLLSRQLGPSRFGELSLIITVAVVASTLTDLGSTQLVVGEMAARPERRRELAAGVAVLRLGAGVALAGAGAVLLVALLPTTQAQLAGLVAMATVPLAGLAGLVVLATARLRPEVGAALSLGQSGLWLAAVVVAGAVGAPLAAYGAAFLACGLAQAAATWWVVGRPEPPDWARWRPALRWMVARGWPLGLAGLMGTIYYRLDGPLLFHLRGAREAGLYAAAYRFLDVAQLAPGALGAVLLPVLARLWGVGDRERFQRALRLAVAVAAAVGAPVAFGAVVAGHRVASAVYGARFERSGDVLAVLGLAFFSIATGYVYAGVLIAMGRVRIVGAVAAVAAVGSLLADLAVIPRWGGVGAAWVTVVTEYVVSTTLALWIHRRHRVAFPWDRVGRALVAGLAMAVVAWPLRSLPLPVLLAAAAGAYAAFAFTVGALRGSDLRALLDRGDVLGP